MTLPYRRLIKDSSVYGLGDLILKSTGFLTVPLYSRLFTAAEYGLLSFVLTATGLLAGVLALGGDSAYARFFFAAHTEREKQVVTSTWFIFLSVWSVCVMLLILPLLGPFATWMKTPTAHVIYVLALLAMPVSLINLMCGQVLRNLFQARLFTVLNTASTLVGVGLGIFAAAGLRLGVAGVLAGFLAGALVMLPVRLWTARGMLRPVFSWTVLRQLLAFGVPLVPTSIAYWVFASSDRFVLAKLSTLEQTGIYAVANSASSVLGMVHGALGQAWSPHLIQVYETQPDETPVFLGRMLTALLVGFGLLCVGLSAFARELLMVWSTPPFYPAALAIGPLALGFLAYATTNVTAAGISLTKRTHHLAIVSGLAAVLNLVLNVWLVPRWGMLASAWATTAAYVFLTGAYLVISQRLLPAAYEVRQSVIAIGLTVGFTVAAPFLPTPGILVGLALKTGYCLAYIAMILGLRVVDVAVLRRLWQLAWGWTAARVGRAS